MENTERIREVFDKADISIGPLGISAFYLNRGRDCVSQFFESDSLCFLVDLLAHSNKFVISVSRGFGSMLSFAFDSDETGDAPTYFFPHTKEELPEEELRERINNFTDFEVDQKALEALSEIRTDTEIETVDGVLKWLAAILINDNNIWQIDGIANWEALKEASRNFYEKYRPPVAYDEIPPLNHGDVGSVVFGFSSTDKLKYNICGIMMEDLIRIAECSSAIEFETTKLEDETLFNLVFYCN